jgi:hypothetical protein
MAAETFDGASDGIYQLPFPALKKDRQAKAEHVAVFLLT